MIQSTDRMTVDLSIGQYLIRRLQDYGIGDVFGIPGDYVLSFYTQMEDSDLNVVGSTREDCAGFAADAYARINGMSALCITYCVGGLSVCNSVAGAFAEKSPIVVISGAPGLCERSSNPLLHHMVRDFDTQMKVFEGLCIAGAELSDPVTAFREIDRVLDACARFKRPVYLELPRDMVDVVPQISHTYRKPTFPSDADALRESVEEAGRLLAAAERPAILAGVEVHRFGLQDSLLALAEATQIPIAATILGKSVIRETHPLYVGLYEGAMGRSDVTKYIEDSDCLLLLGTFMTDINLGIFTANIDPGRCIYATSEQLRIHHHHYHRVRLKDFLHGLIDVPPVTVRRPIPASLVKRESVTFEVKAESPITISRLFHRLNEQLDEKTIVIADIGDSLFAASELVIRDRTEFLSPAYYTSMGFSIPAALGAQIARPESRVVAICGDGAFQMTGQELSTLVRHHFDPVILVLDNQGYGTERRLHHGQWKFNEIQPWAYHRLPEIYGGGRGYEVFSEADFEAALTDAWQNRTGPSVIQVHLHPDDHSSPLHRLAERLSEQV
ncbi:MAG: preprotein translocase subunit Tim44 [Planctomycetaceae bacterium]|nr:preprotein translocase subunit Tim44 [Planctomycetaceae bacterium]